MTTDKIEQYVDKLGPELKKIYWAARYFARDTEDTISDAYQIAATIEDLFGKWAADRDGREPA